MDFVSVSDCRVDTRINNRSYARRGDSPSAGAGRGECDETYDFSSACSAEKQVLKFFPNSPSRFQ